MYIILFIYYFGLRLVFTAAGLFSCGSQALEQRLSSCDAGAYALQHVGSSQTRDQTCVYYIGRQILYH